MARPLFYRRRKKEEGRRKTEEGRRKKEDGRRKKEEDQTLTRCGGFRLFGVRIPFARSYVYFRDLR
ncbi:MULTISPECIES: hypothetical protein [unclassified Microcoleus]|uniref:hypothetical protein n=1 Tax=unclassified Microcoleus TaxID=2642155 RepID=UPI002FCEEC62